MNVKTSSLNKRDKSRSGEEKKTTNNDKLLNEMKKILTHLLTHIPGANFIPNQTENGMQPWCMTCNVETCSFFFRKMKNMVSKNSVNFAM